MDTDVAHFLLALLHETPLQLSGGELSKLAELHERAVAQVNEAAGLKVES